MNRTHAAPRAPAQALRASDQDRERVIDELRQHCGAGRLTLDEFDKRAEAAYAARTVGDLDALVHDLPRPTPDPSPTPLRLTKVHRGCCCSW